MTPPETKQVEERKPERERFCRNCVIALSVSEDGAIYCWRCGLVAFSAEEVQAALKAAKQKGFK